MRRTYSHFFVGRCDKCGAILALAIDRTGARNSVFEMLADGLDVSRHSMNDAHKYPLDPCDCAENWARINAAKEACWTPETVAQFNTADGEEVCRFVRAGGAE